MPSLSVDLIVKAITQGFDKLGKDIGGVGGAVEDTERPTKNAGMRFTELASQISIAKQAFTAVADVAKVAYGAISEGAQLQQAQSQFENLAGSIGTTAESIDTKLKAATNGMMSQAERVSTASQIISLGLANNEEDVTRLAKAMGVLSLDSQQVILTFANNSKARLDSLGLSVEGVTKKAAELEAQGFVGDAFDEAVLIGLEEKMTLLGDSSETTAGSLKTIESAIKDLTDAGKIWMAQKWEGPIKGLANTINDTGSAWDKLVISGAEFNKMMFGVQGVWGAAADKARANAAANAETEESFRAVAEAAALTKDEYNDLIPAIEEASQADYKFADSVAYGTAELVARTEEAVRGAGGMDAYRMGAAKVKTAEELRAEAMARSADELEELKAAQEAETKAMEESIARKEENAKITRELSAATGDYFTKAIEAGDEQANLNGILYEAADAAGASAEQLASLAYITGDYTKAQINAALQTAALTAEAQRLGEAVAAGDITVQNAVTSLQDFARDWTASATINTEESKFRALLRSLVEFDGKTFRATASVSTSGSVPSGPAPSGKGGAKYASGTNGWQTVPGPTGAPFSATLHGGELFNVVPAGQSPAGAGGMTVGAVNIYAAPGQNGEQLYNEFMRKAARDARLKRQ